MTVRKPLIRYASGAGMQEVQLASSDLSDGPFAGAGGGPSLRVLTADSTIASGYSYVICGPLETNGHVLDIEGGIVGVI
jgi:hypothetical protein